MSARFHLLPPRRVGMLAVAVTTLTLVATIVPPPAPADAKPAEVAGFEARPGLGRASLHWHTPPAEVDRIEVRMHVGAFPRNPSPATGQPICAVAATAAPTCTVTGLDGSLPHVFFAYGVGTDGSHGPGAWWALSGTELRTGVSTTSLTWPATVRVSGTLWSIEGVAGHEVQVQASRQAHDGTWSTWTTLATLTTDDTGMEPGEPNLLGQFHLDHQPKARTRYRVRYPGESTFLGAMSGTHRVEVAPKVTADLSATTVRRGRAAHLQGKVAPKLPDGSVILERRRSDGTWRRMETAQLSETGSYRFRLPTNARGRAAYRVRFPAQGALVRGGSPTRTLAVR